MNAHDHLSDNTSAPKITSFDLIIAGGGIAGLLTANRFCEANPGKSVLILEKDSRIGGRLASIDGDARGSGFDSISQKLYDFWDQTLKLDPEANDLPTLLNNKLGRAAVLMGNKFSEFETNQILKEKGFRAMGGLAAQRQWIEVQKIFESNDRFDKTFAEVWKSPRKSPATTVLEAYAFAAGITDIWDSSPGAISERCEFYTDEVYTGDWSQALASLTRQFESKGTLQVHCDARIINAAQANGLWELETSKGRFKSPKLVVAQAPWIAVQWLAKSLWPSQLLAVVNKTKPVSVVTLSCPIIADSTHELPQFVIIPSEQAQATVGDREIVIQATIDYELSLQAPDVVKAVKRLKRSLKKIQLTAPNLKLGPDRVALVPVGWAQSSNYTERKHLDKLKMENLQESQLSFCGDAYGQSLNGDINLINSVISAHEAIRK